VNCKKRKIEPIKISFLNNAHGSGHRTVHVQEKFSQAPKFRTEVNEPEPQHIALQKHEKVEKKENEQEKKLKSAQSPRQMPQKPEALDYMLNLLKGLFHETPLGRQFHVLTGLLVLIEASGLHNLIDTQWDLVWHALRKERNTFHESKKDWKVRCSVFTCSNRVSTLFYSDMGHRLNSIDPHGYCRDHKLVADLFERRHKDQSPNDMLASRLVHLLIPESDKIAGEFDHATAFRNQAHAFPEPFKPKGEFPASQLLAELSSCDPEFYGSLTEALAEYKLEYPNVFPKL